MITDIYRKAATLLEPVGSWGQGTAAEIVNGRAKMCMTAAINATAGRQVGEFSPDLMRPFAEWLVANRPDEVMSACSAPSVERVRLTLEQCGDSGPVAIIQNWNDVGAWGQPSQLGISGRIPEGWHPRYKVEVLAALRECADKLDAEAGRLEGL